MSLDNQQNSKEVPSSQQIEKNNLQKVFQLIYTEDPHNIELALTMCKGLGIDLIEQLKIEFHHLIDLSSNNYTGNKIRQLQFSNLNEFFEFKKDIQHISLLSINGKKYNLIEQKINTTYLENLKKLELIHIPFSTCPTEFTKLTTLTTLTCHNNQLDTIPSTILHFQNLNHLNFSYNQISKINHNVLSQLDLQDIYLSHNQLTQINFSELSKLKILLTVDISNNPIRELIVDDHDISIRILDISNTGFSEFPQELHKLNIDTLCISYLQYKQWKNDLNQLSIITVCINGELFSVHNQTLEQAIERNVNSSKQVSEFFFDFIS